MGVEYFDGKVVGADLTEHSSSSVTISALHVSLSNDKIERKKSSDGMYLLTPPEYKISSGIFVNAAGNIINSRLFDFVFDIVHTSSVNQLDFIGVIL